MKLRRSQLLLPAALIAIVAIPVLISSFSASAGNPKVDICHFPPGNPANFHTIRISANALSAHLAHGDLPEACNAACASICDDGDACTVDDVGDCEENGCPSDRPPVNCDDGLGCTSDSCDSQDGCINSPVVCNAPDLCTVSTCAEPEGVCLEAPVVCGEGETCDVGTGDCVPSVACPCWPDPSVLDNITAEDQAAGSCDPDRIVLGQSVEVYGLVDGVFAGYAGISDQNQNGCQAVVGLDNTGVVQITAEQAAVCIAQITDRCAEIGPGPN